MTSGRFVRDQPTAKEKPRSAPPAAAPRGNGSEECLVDRQRPLDHVIRREAHPLDVVRGPYAGHEGAIECVRANKLEKQLDGVLTRGSEPQVVDEHHRHGAVAPPSLMQDTPQCRRVPDAARDVRSGSLDQLLEQRVRPPPRSDLQLSPIQVQCGVVVGGERVGWTNQDGHVGPLGQGAHCRRPIAREAVPQHNHPRPRRPRHDPNSVPATISRYLGLRAITRPLSNATTRWECSRVTMHAVTLLRSTSRPALFLHACVAFRRPQPGALAGAIDASG